MKKLAIAFLFVGSLMAALPAQAASGFKDYEPGMVKAALAEGKTVFLDYYASWCGTCRAQGRVIDALLEENPAYGESLVMIRVDWDEFNRRNAEHSQSVQVERTRIDHLERHIGQLEERLQRMDQEQRSLESSTLGDEVDQRVIKKVRRKWKHTLGGHPTGA